jgi:hypothetical protein
VNFHVLRLLTPGSGPIVRHGVWKQVDCPACGVHPVGRVGNITVRFRRKDTLLDFVGTASGILFRHSVAEILTSERITGWCAGAVNVEAVRRLQDQDLNYHEFIITGHTRGYAERVGLIVERECDACGVRHYAYPDVEEPLPLPQSCWDGSDVFIIDGLGIRVVTDAFRAAIERNSLSGLEFSPLSD